MGQKDKVIALITICLIGCNKLVNTFYNDFLLIEDNKLGSDQEREQADWKVQRTCL